MGVLIGKNEVTGLNEIRILDSNFGGDAFFYNPESNQKIEINGITEFTFVKHIPLEPPKNKLFIIGTNQTTANTPNVFSLMLVNADTKTSEFFVGFDVPIDEIDTKKETNLLAVFGKGTNFVSICNWEEKI